MQTDTSRIAAGSLVGIAALLALLLALFDTLVAAVLLAALGAGWAIVLALSVGSIVYRRHRTVVLAGLGIGALAALVLLRPDGGERDDDAPPAVVSSYGAELWPNRLSAEASFILRERVVRTTSADGRANVAAATPGPLMREIRFVPGAASGAAPITLAEDGQATIVINPVDGGVVHHAIGGRLSSVELPIGIVTRATIDGLQREVRVAYLVGAGRALAPVASAVTPLRRMPRVLAVLLFVALGAFGANAWGDRVVTPFRKRLTDRPSRSSGPPGGRTTGTPIERAPLVPRRK